MKYFSFFIIGVFVLSFSSCTNEVKSRYLDPKIVFGTRDTLKGEVLPEAIWAKSTVEASVLYSVDPWIISWTNIDGYVVQLHDIKSGKTIYHTGNIGRGPNEILFSFPVGVNLQDSTVYIVDAYGATIHPYKISDSTLVKHDLIKSQKYLFASNAFFEATDSTFFFFHRMKDSFILSDKDFEILDSIPNKPVEMNDETFLEQQTGMNKYGYKKMGFVAEMTLTPNGKRFIAYYFRFPVFNVYEVLSNRIELVNRVEFFEPKYNTAQNIFTHESSQQIGITWMTVTNEYYYALISNYTIGEYEKPNELAQDVPYLMVFDKNGDFVRSFKFDRLLYSINVSPDNKYLYSVIDDYDENREIHIIRYELPEFL